jgi:hypothetical protein
MNMAIELEVRAIKNGVRIKGFVMVADGIEESEILKIVDACGQTLENHIKTAVAGKAQRRVHEKAVGHYLNQNS